MGFWDGLRSFCSNVVSTVGTVVSNAAKAVVRGVETAGEAISKWANNGKTKKIEKAKDISINSTCAETIDTHEALEEMKAIFEEHFVPIQNNAVDEIREELNKMVQSLYHDFPDIDLARLKYNQDEISRKISSLKDEIKSTISLSDKKCRAYLRMRPGADRQSAMGDYILSLCEKFKKNINSAAATLIAEETKNFITAITEWQAVQEKKIAEEQKNLTRAINNSGTQMRGKQDAIAEAQYRLGCSEIILAQIMQK